MSVILGALVSFFTFFIGLGVYIGAPWLYGAPLALFSGLFAGLALAVVGALAGLPLLFVLLLLPTGLVLVGAAAALLVHYDAIGRVRRMLQQFYYVLSQIGFARSKLVKPLDSSSVKLVATEFDSEKGADKVGLGKITAYFRDVAGLSRYMVNRSFGIVDEWHTAVIDPVVADIGARRAQYVDDNADLLDTAKHDGIGTYKSATHDDAIAIGDHVRIPERPPLVDLEASRYCIFEGAEPGDAEIVEEQTKLSQAGFKQSNKVEIFMYAGLFIAALGVVYIAFEMKTGGGGGGDSGSSVTVGNLLLFAATGLRRSIRR